MSGFVICLHTCNLGTKKKEIKNPFNPGKTIEIFQDDGLTKEERKAVTDLFKNVKAKQFDSISEDGSEEEGFNINFSDKGYAGVTMSGGKKWISAGVESDGITPMFFAFVCDLARAGNMFVSFISHQADRDLTVAMSDEQQNKVKARWPKTVVIKTGEELEVLVRQGLKAWKKKYRG